jgi:hypothetical protein
MELVALGLNPKSLTGGESRLWHRDKVDSGIGLLMLNVLESTMGARNRVGRGVLYQPARLHRLAESIALNRFLGSLKFKNSVSVCFS